MSIRESYEAYLDRRDQLSQSPMVRYWLNQESRYVHPFRLYGNVWYVGDSWVCVHLIDTGDGLLLIDSGNCGATAMLVNAIWEAGFNPADVKWIIHSHGHVDHIGGANFFRRMFGTKLYLSEPDARMFRERPELSVIHDSCNDTLGRRAQQQKNPGGPNPFLDSALWGRYLDQKREELLAFMADPANN